MSREARQRVAFRPGTRIGVIAASLAAAAALVLPTTALASTTIGSAVGNVDCGGITADTIQITSSGPSYSVPTGATQITDWFFQAASGDTGSVSLLVWRSGPTAGQYTLIDTSPTVNLSDPSSTFALPAPIAVQAGDLIGLRISGVVTCFAAATAGTADSFWIAPPTATGSPIANYQVGFGQLDVRAAVNTSDTVATSTTQCKNGGWQALTDSAGIPFKNQGDCVSFVATGGTNTAAGS